MGSNLKGIVIVLALGGVIALASYHAAKHSKKEEKGPGYTAILMCSDEACGKVFPQRITAGQPPPYVCKRCGKKTAFRAVKCRECGHVFPYIVQEVMTEEGPPERIETSECPQCRSVDFVLVRSMDELKGARSPEE